MAVLEKIGVLKCSTNEAAKLLPNLIRDESSGFKL